MSKDHVLFIGWNRPVIGREGTASELFASMLNFLGDAQKKNDIASFEPMLLNVHGGDLNGFIVVKGDQEKIDLLRHKDEFMNLVTQCSINVENFGVISGWSGEMVGKQMERWRGYIGK